MIMSHLPLLDGKKVIGTGSINTLFAAYSIHTVQILDGFAYIVSYTNATNASKLYKYNLDTGANSFVTLPNTFAQGITTDGTSLYIVTQTERLLKYSTSLALLSNVNLGSGTPSFISFDAGSLYVSFNESNQVKKLNLSGGVLATYNVGILPSFLRSNANDIVVSGNPVFKINIASGVTTSSVSHNGYAAIRTNGDIYTIAADTLYRLNNSFSTITSRNLGAAIVNIFYHPGLDKVLASSAQTFLILNADTLETEVEIATTKTAYYFGINPANNDIYYVSYNYNNESYLNKVVF